jgi:tetratricopeptide (TPR) repeat protein
MNPDRPHDALIASPDADAPRVRVFLSYARSDDAGSDRAAYDDPARSFMRRLYNALADEFVVWWDMVKMPSRGETFTREIEAAIDDCDRLVLVVAPGALASNYVRAEWQHALARCIPVTPILRAGDYDTIPAELDRLHAPDFRDPRPFAEAVAELRRILGEPTERIAPLYHFERGLPEGHIQRETPFQAAREALLTDAIHATVVSARPQSATAIYGPGGLGKSTLAIALAHDCEVRRRYPDGILWVKVTQTPDLQTRLADIGVCFGDPREWYVGPGTDVESAAGQLNRTLHDRRALLILDDVWEHQHVSYFRVTGTPCRLLITTRSAALAGNIDGADVRLDRLSDAEGAALIAARAGGPPDDPIYMEISRALAGHTLAVTLAAARLKKKGAGYARTILDGLTDPTDPFAHLNVDEQDKDLNLSKSLSLSYDALDDAGQRRFRALGVFAANAAFDLNALAAVWDETEASADRAAEALVDASLLDWEQESGRYSQHPVLRTYARALLNAAGEMLTIFRRYADWVIEASEAFRQLPLEQWSQLDPLIPHVTEVGDALVDHFAEMLPERLAAFGWNVQPFVNKRLMMIETPRGREARGLRWLEAALVVFRQNGDQAKEAAALNNIGGAWSDLGDKRKALAFYEQALPVFQAMGDRGGEARALNNIGGAWDALGDKRKALAFYEQALPVFQAVGDRGGEAAALNNIGGAWSDLGDKRKALAFYEQALPVFQAVGDRSGEAITCFNIGMLHYQLGDLDSAIAHVERCIELRNQMAHPDLESNRRALNQLKAMRDTGQTAQVSILPEETVRMLAGNTIAVMTDAPDKRDEWRGELAAIRADFAGRGDAWTIEVEFADALLAIVDDQPPSIPPDNPYADVVRQVVAAIAAFRADRRA